MHQRRWRPSPCAHEQQDASAETGASWPSNKPWYDGALSAHCAGQVKRPGAGCALGTVGDKRTRVATRQGLARHEATSCSLLKHLQAQLRPAHSTRQCTGQALGGACSFHSCASLLLYVRPTCMMHSRWLIVWQQIKTE